VNPRPDEKIAVNMAYALVAVVIYTTCLLWALKKLQRWASEYLKKKRSESNDRDYKV
jgi:hypothetical protein